MLLTRLSNPSLSRAVCCAAFSPWVGAGENIGMAPMGHEGRSPIDSRLHLLASQEGVQSRPLPVAALVARRSGYGSTGSSRQEQPGGDPTDDEAVSS